MGLEALEGHVAESAVEGRRADALGRGRHLYVELGGTHDCTALLTYFLSPPRAFYSLYRLFFIVLSILVHHLTGVKKQIEHDVSNNRFLGFFSSNELFTFC